MKLIVTYIHEDRTSVRNHGEFLNRYSVDEFGINTVGFEFEGYSVSWSPKLVTSDETVGDEVRLTVDWRNRKE